MATNTDHDDDDEDDEIQEQLDQRAEKLAERYQCISSGDDGDFPDGPLGCVHHSALWVNSALGNSECWIPEDQTRMMDAFEKLIEVMERDEKGIGHLPTSKDNNELED